MSSSPEPAVLRGPSAAQAPSYREALAAPRRRAEDDAATARPQPLVERRATIRRAADQPVEAGRTTLRLGDVYAEELGRLRDRAHAEGYAAGFAEGTAAAEVVVAEAERAAAERLAEVQARWERRLGSAAAALAAGARRLEEAALPVADDVRDSVLAAVSVLVEDLLGRELAVAADPGLDALRRALRLCPADGPVVVRLHPDDLAEIPEPALADLPETVTVVGDPQIERAGAVAETGSRHVDAQLRSALQRVQAVLAT
jgi:flagellar assembly protein FliH